MNVDFDGLRKKIATAYNDVVEILNEKVEKAASSNNLELDMWEIEDSIDDLRDGIATLICLYEESMGIKSMADFHLKVLQSNYSE